MPAGKDATHVTLEAFCKAEGVDLKKGLSSAEVAKRQAEFGPNELEQEEATPLWKLVLEQFDDQLVQILLVAALISTGLAFFEESEDGGIALEAFVEPAVILTILILNAIVGVWQESSAENALEALKKMQSLHTPCLRDGVWQEELPTEELVPGDVVRGAWPQERCCSHLLLAAACSLRVLHVLPAQSSWATRSRPTSAWPSF
jgi:Ca2+-transporting ATPase